MKRVYPGARKGVKDLVSARARWVAARFASGQLKAHEVHGFRSPCGPLHRSNARAKLVCDFREKRDQTSATGVLNRRGVMRILTSESRGLFVLSARRPYSHGASSAITTPIDEHGLPLLLVATRMGRTVVVILPDASRASMVTW